jgi:membrane-bound serine protease (ClpP class)
MYSIDKIYQLASVYICMPRACFMCQHAPTMSTKKFLRQLLALFCIALAVVSVATEQRTAAGKHVYVVPVEGIIDLGLAPFIKRIVKQAESDGAAAVILEINTFGGRVDAAVLIRDALLEAKVPTVAFVNKRAISAGALISLASEKIYMAEGSTIGAAMPVQGGAPGAAAQPVEEKTVSYLRKEFSATAEARGRPALIAEAMVDADVEIADVIAKGKLLTLTTAESLQQGLIDGEVTNLTDLLRVLGLEGAEQRGAEESWAETLVRFLTNPVLSSLLITVGLLGVITEIRTPGFGFPGAIGVAALGLFFWGHWLVELAGYEELLLFLIGVLLLVVEVFVTPGFGVIGALGVGSVLAGLVLSLLGPGASVDALVGVISRVLGSLLLAAISALLLLRVLPRTAVGRRLVLEAGMTAEEGYVSPPEADRELLGLAGVASSPLHPAGVASIAGRRIDVISEGEYIDAGEPITVIRVDGNRVVVKRSN